MRQLRHRQRYLPMYESATLKVVRDYHEKYRRVGELLDRHPELVDRVHGDLAKMSESQGGRSGDYTAEQILRALIVHKLEGDPWRKTVVTIAGCEFLRWFIGLGNGSVMDFTFLNKCFKAIEPGSWHWMNRVLGLSAVAEGVVDPGEVRVDSTVVEANIHRPSDGWLLWDSWRVLERLVNRARGRCEWLSGHRLHGRKVKRDWHYVRRYMATRSKSRRRELKRRFRALVERVERVEHIAAKISRDLAGCSDDVGRQLAEELAHHLPLVRQICRTARGSMLAGPSVKAREKILSLFEEHTELIVRGRAHRPVSFGHQMWLSQTREKFITDFEVMNPRRADSEVLAEIIERHGEQFGGPPKVLAADKGFHCCMEKRTAAHRSVETLAVPQYHPRWDEPAASPIWQDFRAGIEGTISTLKRAFGLARCMYRGFKSFQADVGMAVFCHNLLVLSCRPARC